MAGTHSSLARAYRELGDLAGELRICRCGGKCCDPWCSFCAPLRQKQWLKRHRKDFTECDLLVELSFPAFFDMVEMFPEDGWGLEDAISEATTWVKESFPDLRIWRRSLLVEEEDEALNLVLPFWVTALVPMEGLTPPHPCWDVRVILVTQPEDRELLASKMTAGLPEEVDHLVLASMLLMLEGVQRTAIGAGKKETSTSQSQLAIPTLV